jgi:peptidoglycan/xylan/chitin deacetylase (PgdA/CDA1 family)
MEGFFERVVSVHRKEGIPATFFCKGETVDKMRGLFSQFHSEVKGDSLFDLQDHSYSHVGVCYSEGKPVDLLRADYEKSFRVHEEVFGKRPTGISICGTSDDGPPLSGFDETEKSRAEFEMLAALGVEMINTRLVGVDGSRQFANYSVLGHPEIMGFPSGYSDTSWMLRKEHGDPIYYILSVVTERSGRNEHMPLMFHDWVAWQHAPDKELTHLKRIVDHGRSHGYELVTHSQCYQDSGLWR